MTATSIRLRRHKGFKNFENSEAHNAVNAEAGSVDQTEPEVEEVDSNLTDTPPQEEQESEEQEPTTEEVLDGEALLTSPAGPEDDAEEESVDTDAADAAIVKPNRNQSKETWTTYVGALHTKPEGYSEDLTRDQIADLVLGPKA